MSNNEFDDFWKDADAYPRWRARVKETYSENELVQKAKICVRAGVAALAFTGGTLGVIWVKEAVTPDRVRVYLEDGPNVATVDPCVYEAEKSAETNPAVLMRLVEECRAEDAVDTGF